MDTLRKAPVHRTPRSRGRVPFLAIALTLSVSIAALGCSSSSKSTTVTDKSTATTVASTNSSPGASDDQTSGTWRDVSTNVRVLNLAAGKDGTGEAIDVWSGSGPGSGKKIGSVPFATRSAKLTPVVSKYVTPQTKAGKKVDSYQLVFVEKGATTDTGSISANFDAIPGDELTVLVTRANGMSMGATGLAFTSVYTKLGTERDSLTTPFTDLTIPSGKRAVAVDAHGIVVPEGTDQLAFSLASGGKCADEVSPSTMPTGTQLNVSTGSNFGFAYLLGATDTSSDIAKVGAQSAPGSECAEKVATANLPASLGSKVILFIYGDPNHPSTFSMSG